MGKSLSIALFKNSHKKEDQHPDWNFSKKDGEEWVNVLAGWNRTTQNGMDYISISINLEGLKKYMEMRAEEEKKQSVSNTDIKTDGVIDPSDLPF